MIFTTTLKKNYEFKRLYNRGKSSASQYVAVYCKQNGTASSRLGITVSGKIGGAVIRNRIRRRLKEIYRTNEKSLKPGFDIVIAARRKCIDATYHEIETSVFAVFRKLSLL